jgi:V8-like Glu-specific endopeptidase
MKKLFVALLLWGHVAPYGFARAPQPLPTPDSLVFNEGLLQQVNIFSVEGKDPRAVVDLRREQGLRPVVQISGSTGFLVSPCYALAAYHSIFGTRKPNDPLPSVTDGVPEVRESGSLSFRTVAATPEVWGEGHIQDRIREDWVLLRLNACEGKRVGWMELTQEAGSLAGTPVSMAGYPNDKPRTSLWRNSVGAIHHEGGGVLQDCLLNSAATRGGSSGSPLYRVSAEGLVVLGMQVRVRNEYSGIIVSYDECQTNIALDIRPIRRRIASLLEVDIEAFWAESPDLFGTNPARSSRKMAAGSLVDGSQ